MSSYKVIYSRITALLLCFLTHLSLTEYFCIQVNGSFSHIDTLEVLKGVVSILISVSGNDIDR